MLPTGPGYNIKMKLASLGAHALPKGERWNGVKA